MKLGYAQLAGRDIGSRQGSIHIDRWEWAEYAVPLELSPTPIRAGVRCLMGERDCQPSRRHDRKACANSGRGEARRRLGWVRWLACFMLVGVSIVPCASAEVGTTNYYVRGVLKGVKQGEHQLIIAHEDIPNFMEAMTMPFNVKDVSILTNVAAGKQITFQLHLTETDSWVDHVEPSDAPQSGAKSVSAASGGDVHTEARTNAAEGGGSRNALRYYKFTNELGQRVSLSDFQGQAVALTFFFTRCPIPQFCPRLSRNFQEVERKLSAMENGPTNWHLLSITFDPGRDTPEVLKAYGAAYQYEPSHWSFLTGPADKIAELAGLCDVKFEADNGRFNHNFRTLIIDASNRLQMVFPTSGDISEAIVQELLKAASATNRSLETATCQIGSQPGE